MWVESGFEAAKEGDIGTRAGRTRRRKMPAGSRRYEISSPNVDAALESGCAPRKRGRGVFRRAKRKDTRGGFAEALERSRVVRIGEQSKIEDAAGASKNGVRERRPIGECV